MKELKKGDPVWWRKPSKHGPWLAQMIPARYQHATPKKVAILIGTMAGEVKKLVPANEITIEKSRDRT